MNQEDDKPSRDDGSMFSIGKFSRTLGAGALSSCTAFHGATVLPNFKDVCGRGWQASWWKPR